MIIIICSHSVAIAYLLKSRSEHFCSSFTWCHIFIELIRNLGGIIATRDILLREIRVLKISAFIALKITAYVAVVIIHVFILRDHVMIMALF